MGGVMMRLVMMLLLGVMCLTGCGGEEVISVEEPGQEQIRPVLEQVVKTGQLDSGIMIVQEQLEAMKQDDPSKAERLLKQLDDLQSQTSPNEIKAAAQKILNEL
jgi:hypothetical protein